MSHHLSPKMQACIDECQTCHTACLSIAMHQCLEVGGKHTEPHHFKLMMDCAAICQTAADFMARGSEHHKHLCRECAEICRACAASCEQVGDMQACVDACLRCAASCEAMAG